MTLPYSGDNSIAIASDGNSTYYNYLVGYHLLLNRLWWRWWGSMGIQVIHGWKGIFFSDVNERMCQMQHVCRVVTHCRISTLNIAPKCKAQFQISQQGKGWLLKMDNTMAMTCISALVQLHLAPSYLAYSSDISKWTHDGQVRHFNHNLNQFCLIFKRTSGNKFQWNFNQYMNVKTERMLQNIGRFIWSTMY